MTAMKLLWARGGKYRAKLQSAYDVDSCVALSPAPPPPRFARSASPAAAGAEKVSADTRSIQPLCGGQAHLNPPGVGVVQTLHDPEEERVEVANVRNARPRCRAHCAGGCNECEF